MHINFSTIFALYTFFKREQKIKSNFLGIIIHMAEIIYMPKLSDTMTEGVVAEWTKKIGDSVSSGEVLAEIETDKATMEFESFYDGVLLHIGVEKGQIAPVNAILAIIGQEGEDIQALLSTQQNGQDIQTETPSLPEPQKNEQADKLTDTTRVFASPLAKKIASEKGIDILQVQGTGEGGRIVKRDIDQYEKQEPIALPTHKKSDVSTENIQQQVGVDYTDEPITQMRKTIARRLAESKFSAPHFYLTIEVDMTKAIKIRNKLNHLSTDTKISFNDLVIKAVALSLVRHPAVNSSWLGDTIRVNHHVNIGVAVAVEDGLLVPVVRFANTKGLVEIGNEVRELAKKAKNKKLQPSEWEGNTFTISNLGMFGIQEFTAIINPPDSCILAVGSIEEKPVVKNKHITVGHKMKMTLSCDHRIVDGTTGAAFLQTLKTFIENPLTMML